MQFTSLHYLTSVLLLLSYNCSVQLVVVREGNSERFCVSQSAPKDGTSAIQCMVVKWKTNQMPSELVLLDHVIQTMCGKVDHGAR